jgi:hypothetical protein
VEIGAFDPVGSREQFSLVMSKLVLRQ